MNDVTRILRALEQGEPKGGEQLLPLVYGELRRLAAQKMAQESPGQTLQPTALVHEAYLRLVGPEAVGLRWDGRGHFFAAAAEAMRRILIERARRQKAARRGGGRGRLVLDDDLVAHDDCPDVLLALDEALGRFEKHDPQAAQLVKLRYFSGLTHQEAAQALGISRRAADRLWLLAKAWLYREMEPP
jgi:RNA polymerase sigma factor (TIGR02999 family)